MLRLTLAAGLLVGCASGRSAGTEPEADAAVTPVDARPPRPDGEVVPPDAQTIVPSADAAVDAPYQCTVMTKQLLVNPVLDLNPSGMGWVQFSDSNAALITGDDGVAEHSPPFKAWLGGIEGDELAILSVTDVLYQDVLVPAGTTQLKLTGYYDVKTLETESAIYDRAQVALVQTNGTPIETVKSLTNLSKTTSWVAINHTFASPQAGNTVRLRLTTTNDIYEPTSFYFDTLALTATVCE
jgi:hypothetical protein